MIALIALISCGENPLEIETQQLNSGTHALLQAISIVDENTAWVSGHDATILITLDGGNSWNRFVYEQADTLQFRDIHAFEPDKGIVMAAGSGNMSQIFQFDVNSGFTKTYQMKDSMGFLNTIEFWDKPNGLAFGDSFNGALFVLKTMDGGSSWSRINPKNLPAAGDAEGGFAASGTCIATRPGGKAWIGTGAGGNGRVLFTEDFGDNWTAYTTPMVKGDAAGITSIRMLNDQTGTIVGGDLYTTDAFTSNIAITQNGGKTWEAASRPVTKGAFYGSDLISYGGEALLVVCGPGGMDSSTDMGAHFVNLDTTNYWAVDMHPSGFGYAAGPDGKLLKLTIE